mmetsp:Transcript_4746/g.9155  ORF Transcript_4746/g.9155 Transcript_4746/m.9155 type:complete len:1670 (+) Transcript_4746:58-5067(+)|eukprot:CAMPEP_0175174042 /NCGR_PEP_ID=MMETSP0087-20121206/32403_1 /TAXON_ID=136419 /ORGANISM="Unknown Unknown, Strain D1" /LENGTH=1669 /DNA_ID=CAMNT_0016465449 /DNA_START=39 /DNA_END=5048 /DNA_ORIENTATION=+
METIKPASNVQVYVRVRPPNDKELSNAYRSCLEVKGASLVINSKPEPKTFTFDQVAGEEVTQEDVFQNVGKPISDTCLAGYNGTIFAYGQTGSGKTHTITGPSLEDEQRGILPRVFQHLCAQMARNERKAGGRLKYLCHASFLEIYNERIFDLMDNSANSLNLREDMKNGVFVDNLSTHPVSNASDAMAVMEVGIQNRRVGETAMNRESSRSHSVFCLSIQSEETKDGVTKKKKSVFNLIDLAGSERQKSTNASGARLKEASGINKSLSALGNVIMSLVTASRTGKAAHVHYRDSKLTFLLRDSLGGNSLTHIIACVSPASDAFGETLSTLKFAQRAKQIKNKAVINEDQTGNVEILMDENTKLKEYIRQLQALQTANSRRMSLTMAAPMSPLAEEYLITPEKRKTTSALSNEVPTSLLESMVEESLAREKSWMEEVEKLKQTVDQKQDLISQHEKQHTSDGMLLRLKDNHIFDILKKFTDSLPSSTTEVTAALQEEVDFYKNQLEETQKQLEYNPKLLTKDLKIAALEEDLKRTVAPEPVSSHRENFALSQKLMALASDKDLMDKRLSELQATLNSPRKILDSMSTPERRKFESVQVQQWEKEQEFSTKMQMMTDEMTKAQEDAIGMKMLLDESYGDQKLLLSKIEQLEEALADQQQAQQAMLVKHEKEISRINETNTSQTETMKAAYESQLEQAQAGMEQTEQNRNRQAIEFGNLQSQMIALESEKAGVQARLEESEAAVSTANNKLKIAQEKAEETQATFTTKMKDLNKTIEGLTIDLSSVRSNLKAKDEEINQAKSQLQAGERKVADMTSEAKKLTAQVAELSQVASKANSIVDDLEQKLASKSSDYDKLAFNAEMLQEDQENLLDMNSYTEDLNAQLKQQLSDLEAKQASTEEELATSQLLAGEQLETIQSLRKEMENIVAQNTSSDDKVMALYAEKQEIQMSLDMQTEHAQALEKEVSEVKKQAERGEQTIRTMTEAEANLQTQLADFRVAFQGLQTKYSDKQREEQELKSQVANHLEQVKNLEAEASVQVKKIETLEKWVKETEIATQETCQEMQQEMDSVQQKLAATESELSKKENKIAKAKETVAEKAAELKSVKAELSALKKTAAADKKSSEKKIEKMTAELQSLQEQHNQTVNELQEQAKELEATNSQQEAQLDSLNETIVDMQSKCTSLREQKDKLEQEVAVVQEFIADLQGEQQGVSTRSSAEKSSSLSQLDAFKARFTELKEATPAAQEQARELQAQVEQLQIEKRSSTAKFAASQKEVKRLEREVTKLEKKIVQLDKTLDTKKAAHSQLTADMEAAKIANAEKLSELQAQMDEASKSLSAAESKCVNLEESFSQAQKELAAEKESSKKSIAALTAQYKASQDLLATHAADADAQTFEAARLQAQVKLTTEKLKQSLKDKEQWLEDMNRCRIEEERAFEECEKYRSDFENSKVHLRKLERELKTASSDVEELKKVNAKLIGHQNPKQKIQHHMKIKKENDTLKQEKANAEREIRRLKLLLKKEGIVFQPDKENSSAASNLQKELDAEEELNAKFKDLSNEKRNMDEALCIMVEEIQNVVPSAKTKKSATESDAAFDVVKVLLSQFKAGQDQLTNVKRQLSAKEREMNLLQAKSKLREESAQLSKGTSKSKSQAAVDDEDFMDGAEMFASFKKLVR